MMAIDFIKESGDPIQGPMLQTKLLRGTLTNMLVVKLSYLCSDGAGVKEYINLLGAIFRKCVQSTIIIVIGVSPYAQKVKFINLARRFLPQETRNE
ncbi:hypothetical protein COJ65_28305 [Bacillus cereus]|nr:hypothetical protein COJ65_28305 [Bacillus cereus]